MAKKKPTAKQIAARKKFAAAVRSGKFLKKKSKKKTKTSTPKTQTRKRKSSKSRSMPRKSKSKGSSKRKLPIVGNPTFKKAALAAGTVALLSTGANAIGAGDVMQNKIVRAGIGWFVGDIPGALAGFATGSGGVNIPGFGGGGMGGGGGMA